MITVQKIKTITELSKNLNDLTNYGYFLFCYSGKGKFSINNSEIEIKTNSIINLITNSKIQISIKEQVIDAILIKYDQNIKEILSTHSMTVFCPTTGATQIKLEESLFLEILFYIKKIEKELNNKEEKSDEIILLNLIMIVKEFSRTVGLENTVRKISDKTILSFINLVDQDYQASRKVDFYADQLFITKKTLYRTFKNKLGFSPKEFINFKLSMEAKKMMLHTNLSVKEISSNLGFQSPYNFTNFFKKNNNNSSPTEYKSRMSKNHILLS